MGKREDGKPISDWKGSWASTTNGLLPKLTEEQLNNRRAGVVINCISIKRRES